MKCNTWKMVLAEYSSSYDFITPDWWILSFNKWHTTLCAGNEISRQPPEKGGTGKNASRHSHHPNHHGQALFVQKFKWWLKSNETKNDKQMDMNWERLGHTLCTRCWGKYHKSFTRNSWQLKISSWHQKGPRVWCRSHKPWRCSCRHFFNVQSVPTDEMQHAKNGAGRIFPCAWYFHSELMMIYRLTNCIRHYARVMISRRAPEEVGTGKNVRRPPQVPQTLYAKLTTIFLNYSWRTKAHRVWCRPHKLSRYSSRPFFNVQSVT